MSIATKRGDGGETDLLYGRRVSKWDLRVFANSKIDELNARLGFVRSLIKDHDPDTAVWIETLQNKLFAAMGEVAVFPEDFARHAKSDMPKLDDSFLTEIESRLTTIEEQVGKMKGWSVPGESQISAAFHLARTACRQAEVAIVRLKEEELLNPDKAPLLMKGLNRLSDLLWLEAKLTENK